MGKKPKQIMYDCHTERKEKPFIFFSIRFTMTLKNYFTFSNKIKKQNDPPYNLLN